MGVNTQDNKLVIITNPKNIHFDLVEDANNSLQNEIDSIIKHNEFSAIKYSI